MCLKAYLAMRPVYILYLPLPPSRHPLSFPFWWWYALTDALRT